MSKTLITSCWSGVKIIFISFWISDNIRYRECPKIMLRSTIMLSYIRIRIKSTVMRQTNLAIKFNVHIEMHTSCYVNNRPKLTILLMCSSTKQFNKQYILAIGISRKSILHISISVKCRHYKIQYVPKIILFTLK